MNTSFKKTLLHSSVSVVFGSLLILTACGDDNDNKAPSNPVVTGSGGSGNKGGSSNKGGTSGDGEGGDDSGGSSNKGGTSGKGGSGGKGGKGGSGGEPPKQDCEAELVDDCWVCPQEHEQFLTQCTDSECFPFDNDSIPYLGDDGSVPETLP